MRHQHDDGHWSSANYFSKCKSPSEQCKSRHAGFSEGNRFNAYDVGVTGLALLAFASQEYTHKKGENPEYVKSVEKAVKWLLKQQDLSDEEICKGIFGTFSHHRAGGEAGYKYKSKHNISDKLQSQSKPIAEEWAYNHAIATKALLEILILSKDKELLSIPTQNAVNWCLAAQHSTTHSWGYGYQDVRGGNNSVLGWFVNALFSASKCHSKDLVKLEKSRINSALTNAVANLKSCTNKKTGQTGYEGPTDKGSFLNNVYNQPYPYTKELSSMTAIRIFCHRVSGGKAHSKDLRLSKKLLKGNMPTWSRQSGKKLSRINMYYWYFGTCAQASLKGSDWNKWKKKLSEALLTGKKGGKGQRTETQGCEHGSWDPIGEWGAVGGRVYSTAISIMALSVDPKDFKK